MLPASSRPLFPPNLNFSTSDFLRRATQGWKASKSLPQRIQKLDLTPSPSATRLHFLSASSVLVTRGPSFSTNWFRTVLCGSKHSSHLCLCLSPYRATLHLPSTDHESFKAAGFHHFNIQSWKYESLESSAFSSQLHRARPIPFHFDFSSSLRAKATTRSFRDLDPDPSLHPRFDSRHTSIHRLIQLNVYLVIDSSSSISHHGDLVASARSAAPRPVSASARHLLFSLQWLRLQPPQ